MRKTKVGELETRHRTMLLVQKFKNELVGHGRARTIGFRTEMVVRNVGLEEKIHVGHGISVRKPMVRQPFQSETEGREAMGQSHLSQSHDFANPRPSQPLNL